MTPIALSALSGLLCTLSFPRFDLEWLAWVALIPLFFAIYGQTPQRAAGLGGVTGLVFYLSGMTWITNTLVNYGNIPVALSWLILFLLVAYTSL